MYVTWAVFIDFTLTPIGMIVRKLFNWLWPPIVQQELDWFQEYWNTHRVRKQKNKRMPSGGTPLDFYTCPQDYDRERLSVPVEQKMVDDICANLSVSHEEAFC